MIEDDISTHAHHSFVLCFGFACRCCCRAVFLFLRAKRDDDGGDDMMISRWGVTARASGCDMDHLLHGHCHENVQNVFSAKRRIGHPFAKAWVFNDANA